MRILATLFLLPSFALADIVVPVRTLRPESIITAQDLTVIEGERLDAFERVENVVGQEARVALYAGRPILLNSIGPPAIVERNQIVTLLFEANGLVIRTDGRALERAGLGDRIRVMNVSSRATLFGYVQPDGSIAVKP